MLIAIASGIHTKQIDFYYIITTLYVISFIIHIFFFYYDYVDVNILIFY